MDFSSYNIAIDGKFTIFALLLITKLIIIGKNESI